MIALDDLKKLHQKKYRYEFGCFLVEGEHLLSELARAAQQNPALLDSQVYVTDRYQNYSSPFKTHAISEKRMKQLSDTQSPQGIIACVPMAALRSRATSDQAERAIYLYEVQDPGNLGTILRTMAWFGGCRCLLSACSVDPFNSKVLRASMGAVFHVRLELDVSISELLRRYADIACLDMNGESLKSAAFHHSACLAFGNEARGVPAELVQNSQVTRFTVPGSGQIDSLNLASVVNMCLYELNR